MSVPMMELARQNTGLTDDALRHLQRLVASWRALADLSFSDLLLLVPVEGEGGRRFVVLGQVRPTTGQTLYPDDLVGRVVEEVRRPLVTRAFRLGDALSGVTAGLGSDRNVRIDCVPVRFQGRVVAVMTRESTTTSGRRTGELERHYREVFSHFVRMVSDGAFPFAHDETVLEEAPRVGDGVIVLGADRRVRFASPNAVSALHRLGIHAATTGLELGEVGFDPTPIEAAWRSQAPVTVETRRGDTSVVVNVLPLLEDAAVVGGIAMLRDVSDLRRRDRMLVTKDATIREIHHRVKNNLQTIAALLRLQARRLQSDEARSALEESERRIRSIAVVHETLSRDAADVVPFDDIVRPLARLVEEASIAPEARVAFVVEGHVGDLPGDLATPLAVVLNELMQNAVDHAFPAPSDGRPVAGRVRVTLHRVSDGLEVVVADDGIGLPAGFDLASSAGLGLSIVHTLVASELGGSLQLTDDDGTRVVVRIPLPR